MIEVQERIDVPSAPQTVWKILSDPYAVAECVPGATVGERNEDGSYDAGMIVSFGPARVSFQAQFQMELDPATLSGSVSSRGKDKQGGARVKGNMNFRVVEQDPGSSSVFIEAQAEVGGRLAYIIESGASIVVRRMVGEFTRRLEARLNGAALPTD